MASKIPHDVSPFLQRVRALLLAREHQSPLRFPGHMASRDQPPPVLPDGCSSKLSDNYYHTRDGRRLVTPAEIVAVNKSSGEKVLIASKSSPKSGTVAVTAKKAKTPGPLYLPPLANP